MPIDLSLLDTRTPSEDTYDLEPSITRQILNTLFTPIRPILDVLNYPGDTVRGLLAGKGMSSFLPGEENRTSGKDLVEAHGGSLHDGFLGVLESIGVEIATDPIALATVSVSGLTRAGKAAQELSRIKEGINVGNAFNAVKIESKLPMELAGFGNEAFNAGQASAMKRAGELIRSGVDELAGYGNDALSAATKRELQIKAGQRGVSFGFPEVINKAIGLPASAEYVPELLNKALTPVNKLIGRTGEVLGESTVGKKLKEMFQSTSDNTVAQTMKDAKLTQHNYAMKLASESEKEADKAINALSDTLYRPSDAPYLLKPTGDVPKKTYLAQEAIGVPKRADDELLKYHISRTDRLAQEISHASILRDIEVMKPDLTGFDHAAAQGMLEKKVTALNKKYQSDLMRQFNKVQKVKAKALTKLGFINDLGGVPEEFMHRVHGAQEQMLKALQANYVKIDNAENWQVSYVRRLQSEEAKALTDINPTAKRIINNDIKVSGGITKDRAIAWKPTDEANALMKKELRKAGIKVDFDVYKFNPVESARDYWVQANDIQHNVRQTNAAIELLAKPMPLKAAPEELAGKVSLGEMLKTQGLNGIELAPGVEVKWNAGASGEDIHRAILSTAKKHKLDPVAWNKYIDAEDWKFLSAQEIVKNDSMFHSIIGPINQLYKTFILAYPPASIQHIGTNLFGNQWANTNAGVGSVKYLWQAAKMKLAEMAEHNPDGWAAKFMPDYANIDRSLLNNFYSTVASSKNFAQEMRPSGIYKRTNKAADITHILAGGRMPADAIKTEQALGKVFGKLAEKHFEINDFVEEVSKLAHFVGKVDQGSDVWAAAQSVRKYLFDYDQLTPFEKKYMQPTVLFYTFARKNLPLQLQEIISNRKAYTIAKTIDGTTRDEDFIPQYLKNGGNIMTGPGSFLNLRNPAFEINKFSPQGGGAQRVADQVVNQLSPGIRLPIELFTGRESFRGKPLEDLNRVSPEAGELLDKFGMVDKIKTSSGMDYRLNSSLYQVLRNLPTARIQNTFANLINQDMYDSPAYSFLSLTGGSWKQFNPDILKNRVLQEKITAKLGETPGVRKFSDFFDTRETKDEKIKQLLGALKGTGDTLNQLYKENPK